MKQPAAALCAHAAALTTTFNRYIVCHTYLLHTYIHTYKCQSNEVIALVVCYATRECMQFKSRAHAVYPTLAIAKFCCIKSV